jgi:hypothetical protein
MIRKLVIFGLALVAGFLARAGLELALRVGDLPAVDRLGWLVTFGHD